MDGLTHLFVGCLLAVALGGGALGALALAFAVLPDLDTIVWFVPRLRSRLAHRGVTHSAVFGLGAGLAASLVAHVAGWAPFLPALAAALVGFASHVGLDMLNWGCQLLLPWRSRRVEWTVHGGFVWTAILSVAGISLLAAVRALAPAALAPLALALGATFVAYLAARIVLKAAAQRRNPDARVYPTGNPFVWVAVPRGAVRVPVREGRVVRVRALEA